MVGQTHRVLSSRSRHVFARAPVQVGDAEAQRPIADHDPSTALEVPSRRGVPRALDETSEHSVGYIVSPEAPHRATRRHGLEQQGIVDAGC